ncbi:STAS domain-containing protein [Paracrocinitomix mangrovi]|uniref:STAS domain-containing protein n=1 Tax=Paracrocinitomix mangrovi TaxID=2862509 RepID=UPI001C8D4ECA|nr:STAS domain-containing protein [Paracrocinitomix mangrovi]UKN02541.1 STAS domain-containing protein [Paracrocinitomix mangrovi]
MNFSKEEKDNYTIVTSNVEKLDSTNAPELKSELVLINKNSVNNIVLDMSQSRYCDSSGLSAILIGNRLCKDSGGKFVISGLQPNVMKLVEISQLNSVLNIEDSLSDAESTMNS